MGIEVALAAAAIGSVVGGIQQSNAASDQAKIAERNQQQAQEAAKQSRIEAGERADISRRDTQRLKSKQLVGFLSSGVRLEGTPLDVLAETERLGEEDVQSILRGGEARASEFGAQAANFGLQGDIARTKGRGALIGGLTQGIGKAFSAQSGGGGA